MRSRVWTLSSLLFLAVVALPGDLVEGQTTFERSCGSTERCMRGLCARKLVLRRGDYVSRSMIFINCTLS